MYIAYLIIWNIQEKQKIEVFQSFESIQLI